MTNTAIKRSGVAVSLATLALLAGAAGLVPGVGGVAHASTRVSNHRPAPSAPAPSPTAAPAASTLNPGSPPSSVPATTTRLFLGVVDNINDGSVPATVRAAGRYTLEYDTSLPGAFNNVVDGVTLQQSGVGYQTTGYSQTFTLSAGKHVITLGGPEVYGPAREYLVGPLAG